MLTKSEQEDRSKRRTKNRILLREARALELALQEMKDRIKQVETGKEEG